MAKIYAITHKNFVI